VKGTGKSRDTKAGGGQPLVAILMGSDSDWGVMAVASERLTSFGVAHEAHVLSAHRSPEETARFARDAKQRGLRVFICGAGAAAHLAGAVSAQTTLPVLGVPLDASGLGGLDALLATVQMPAGIPVGTLAIGKAGADNAAILAVQILALADRALAAKLDAHKTALTQGVAEKDRRLQETMGKRRTP
jgi:5-(carboxyamino)imidazole ribonucleotide mutase